MHKLKLTFTEKTYPYLDEPHDSTICWGEIALTVTQNGSLIKEIISTEWDIKELIIWLFTNKQKILSEKLPFEGNINDSLAKQIYSFYNTDESLDEDQIDFMYNYRLRHGLRFGLRGVDIDDVYLGKNGNQYEISFCNDSNFWCFQVDVISFYNELESDFEQLYRTTNN